MKQKIVLSKFASLLTAFVFVLLFAGCFLNFHDKRLFFILLAIYIGLVLAGLFYGTLYVKADTGHIFLGSPLRSHKLNMRDVESVELFQPTMGAIRLFASGGFMGYWGLYREGDIGRYYAFYGKASDCFIVRMKDGGQYVLGCENPREMADYISSHMNLCKRSGGL